MGGMSHDAVFFVQHPIGVNILLGYDGSIHKDWEFVSIGDQNSLITCSPDERAYTGKKENPQHRDTKKLYDLLHIELPLGIGLGPLDVQSRYRLHHRSNRLKNQLSSVHPLN